MRVNVNKYIGSVLSAGVILSLTILVWGSALFMVKPATISAPGSVGDILRGAARLDPSATINLGLLALLITPVARVIAAFIAFAAEKDRKYALVSFAVLVILAISAIVDKF